MAIPPNTLRPGELPEFPLRGPFGGIQTELPADAIEKYGFAYSLNMMFRRGTVGTRPGLRDLENLGEPCFGFASFWDADSAFHQVAFGATALYEYDITGQIWNAIGGAINQDIQTSWTVCANLLLFSDAGDIKSWDGSGSVADAGDAPNAKFVGELGTHAIALHLDYDGSPPLTQRVAWSDAGDPTNWSTGTSGQTDLFNDLGPITGFVKLFQTGYIFQKLGITQMIPTGLGNRPFDFVPLSSNSKGNFIDRSLACFGENIAIYAGKDNIYLFDGVSSYPIGDSPLVDTRIRLGARTRIMSDLSQASDLDKGVMSLISTGITLTPYNAYWLIIQNNTFQTATVWVYNLDEGNWTTFDWPSRLVNPNTIIFDACGRITGALDQLLISELVGTIADQTWFLGDLVSGALEAPIFAFTDESIAVMDVGIAIDESWSLETGQMSYGDYRHQKTLVKVRIILQDTADGEDPLQFQVTAESETGQTETVLVTFGMETGNYRPIIVPFKMPGMFHKLTVEGDADHPVLISEITPIYDVSGEQRGVDIG